MNKKILIIVILIVLLLGVVITFGILKKGDKKVDRESNNNSETNTNQNETSNSNQNTNQKVAIIYFSATGTTKEVATALKEVTNGDLIEIIPEEKYTSNDLNYNSDCRANREQQDSTARPKIANKIEVDKYDVIYLGYPIWWGTVPKIILTFLDTYDLTGKIVIPFCTSGGSGIEQSLTDLKNYKQNIEWIEGKRFTNSSKQEIQNWVNSLDIKVRNEESKKITITVNSQKLSATLVDNSSTKVLLEKLEDGPITIDMHDYGNFEKVGSLGFDLPRNDEELSTDAGDIILYQGNSFVIYYDKNNWNFTKLGHIDNISKSELKTLLGSGNVTATISKE